jgi:hypothetical protein
VTQITERTETEKRQGEIRGMEARGERKRDRERERETERLIKERFLCQTNHIEPRSSGKISMLLDVIHVCHIQTFSISDVTLLI